ncbi:phosphate/phosphite/phosphonate ABC transporter substrate-binding protein [Cognatishimia activa]|uniref:PhnD/SsuA/transferrin family substrate-binding protein n=1 Tax=Cognatishimia activa TaxID=1715691 RepID=A0A975EQ30_9RHOB|nr:PhnD/SsuA/transferrin family substrate-binding protein [Cognatishimia activa]QTN36064.1 PhnD/SsuA/transferrin family substrate-binding protein [Cognatishimia activa]
MIAALGMYDRPETAAANDALWTAIQQNLGYGPDGLTRDQDFWDIWQSPDLLLAQTCGLPYRAKLHDKVTLVGTPIYDIPDCDDGHYYSVLVAHADAADELSDFDGCAFAYNEALSQSGWAAPTKALVEGGIKPGNLLETGAHRASAIAVAEGRADLAGLDVVTWQLIQRHDAFANDLKVIAKTEPTPVLPLISAQDRDPDPLFDAIDAAISALPDATRDALFLRGLTHVPKADYLAQPIPIPPESFDLRQPAR